MVPIVPPSSEIADVFPAYADGHVPALVPPATAAVASGCPSPAFTEDRLAEIVDALVSKGYIMLSEALPVSLALALQQDCHAHEPGDFRPAGVGREQAVQLDTTIRTDEICWIDETSSHRREYLDVMDALRLGLNRHLFMGLFDYECHYARYVPGARYHVHLDAFEGKRNRILSTVLYLNDNWQQGQGGELVLYAPDGNEALEIVAPVHNRMMLYLSERFPHEVMPAVRTRYSLTGWFRIRPEQSWRRPV